MEGAAGIRTPTRSSAHWQPQGRRTNPDYQVRWGRLILDHASAQRCGSGSVQRSAGSSRRISRRAAGPGAGGRGQLRSRAPPNWRTRRWKRIPKLVEAQELLARLALEDNDNREGDRGGQEGTRHRPEFGAGGKAMLATIDLLADQEGHAVGPARTRRGYDTIGHFFVLNRRYEEGIGYYRKAIELDPQLYQRAQRTGRQPDAAGAERGGLQATGERASTTGYKSNATVNSLQPAGQLQELRHLQDGPHHSEAGQEGGGAVAAVLRRRDAARHFAPTRRSTS